MSPTSLHAPVVVVGAGPAGLRAARRAVAQLAGTARRAPDAPSDGSPQVLLVESGRLGGRQAWAGWAAMAALAEGAAPSRAWSLVAQEVAAAGGRDLPAPAQLRAEGVGLLPGRARFAGRAGRRGDLLLDVVPPRDPWADPDRPTPPGPPMRLTAGEVVIATGTRPAAPQVSGSGEVRLLTVAELLTAAELPHSLLVLGAGGPGVALAQAFARLGSKVTVLDDASRVLPEEEPAAGQAVATALEADGVRLLLGCPVTAMAPTLDGGAWVATSDGGDLAASHVVLAGDDRPALPGLNLSSIGVTLDAGGRAEVGPDGRLARSVRVVGSAAGAQPPGLRVIACRPVVQAVGRPSPAATGPGLRVALPQGGTLLVATGAPPGRPARGRRDQSDAVLLGACVVGGPATSAAEAAEQLAGPALAVRASVSLVELASVPHPPGSTLELLARALTASAARL